MAVREVPADEGLLGLLEGFGFGLALAEGGGKDFGGLGRTGVEVVETGRNSYSTAPIILSEAF